MITEIYSLAEYESELAKPGLAVLDFYSPNCGPCHMIAPLYNQIAQDQTTVRFYKVNGLDDAGCLVQRKAAVTWWPTLVVYKEGKEIWRDRVPNPPSGDPLRSLEVYLSRVDG
ncbi:thioredoxin-like protein [Aspergillus coremiiformis]|uniref:Thioredoxin-like protein n=1 Tax=Aspergillus coremiiformis TaxID=138285 RepID=A0A5N6ZIE4_9EURO|nr:thioredoxin-like protein [Aspergillus coremiiformis]